MLNRAKYQQANHDSPKTAWTKIVESQTPESPEALRNLHELIESYDRPLNILFQAFECDTHKAEDLKQEFVVSGLIEGGVFKKAQRGNSFRKYLAVCVRNFIHGARTKEQAKKRRADNATAFSQKGDPERPFADTLATEPVVAEEVVEANERRGITEDDGFFDVLTRARAIQIYDDAVDELETWSMQQDDSAAGLGMVRMFRERESIRSIRRTDPSVSAARKQFMSILMGKVREELYISTCNNADDVCTNEIDTLLKALDRGGRF